MRKATIKDITDGFENLIRAKREKLREKIQTAADGEEFNVLTTLLADYNGYRALIGDKPVGYVEMIADLFRNIKSKTPEGDK